MTTFDGVHHDRLELLGEGLEYLSQGFSIFDRELRLAAWNGRFLELLDFPGEMGTLGRPLGDFFRFNAERGDYGPGDAAQQVEERLRLAAKAEPHCFERVRPNGMVIEVRGTPLPGGGFVTTYTDVTERKRWEDDLQQARSRAEEANRAKSAFLNMVSHDLRTPLTSIRSFAEILEGNPGIDLTDRQQFLGIIRTECLRLIRMLNDLLDYAKIEAGQMDWHLTEIDPRRLAEAAVASMAPMFEEKHVELALTIPAVVPPVTGDEDRLTQVIVNLLSNACKHVPEASGRVEVVLCCSPDEVTLSVSDNGPGVPPEKREAIFEEFRQVAARDGSLRSGTGLGLAICRRIVTHLGGRIWVDASREQGSAFHFTLPIDRDRLGGEDGVGEHAGEHGVGD